MEIYLFKLNGWSSNFDERIVALSKSVDSLVIFRSRPDGESNVSSLEGVSVVDIPPTRGTFVTPGWVKPFVFFLHVFFAVVAALAMMLKKRRRPDAVHALDYILGGFSAMLTATASRVPLVVSVRGLKEPAYRNMVSESGTRRARVNYRILVTLSRLIIPRAAHIVTKAEYQREFVRETYGVTCGFTTAPTGVDFETFDPARVPPGNPYEALFSDVPVDLDDSTIVLYLGKFLPRKGFDRLVEFVEELDDDLPEDVVFIAVGGFRDESFERRLSGRLDALGTRFLVHSERVDFEDVPALLATADATTLLSEPANEGVPRVLQESCAMQTPIVAADVTGIARAFDGLPGCTLVDRDDSTAFEAAIYDVRESRPEMPRNVFRERFDITSNYAKYADAYAAVQ
ncbi:glycosyltransferase [Haloarchaeobius litoreus]|uniref:Glycosyltransferase n=1 Tax=Haloarchaeobius litoreus TaxID=755306 RepID=A0ABD6DJU0_9EURY|nr:glycosyltransferase [Haloarchaeobius litoreus]